MSSYSGKAPFFWIAVNLRRTNFLKRHMNKEVQLRNIALIMVNMRKTPNCLLQNPQLNCFRLLRLFRYSLIRVPLSNWVEVSFVAGLYQNMEVFQNHLVRRAKSMHMTMLPRLLLKGSVSPHLSCLCRNADPKDVHSKSQKRRKSRFQKG